MSNFGASGLGEDIDLTQDIGPMLCEELRIAMNTDEPEYYEQMERGYRWWPHRLCQRVEARPPVMSHDVAMSRVDIETPILENVESTPSVLKAIAFINRNADLSALLLDEHAGVVSLHASIGAHPQNLHVAAVLGKHAVALQAAVAEIFRPRLGEMLGGDPIEPELPGGGHRQNGDPMLDVIDDLHVPIRDKVSVFIEHGEFARAESEVAPMVSLMTSAGEDGLTAEFRWGEGPSMPVIMRTIIRSTDGADPTGPSTALFQLMGKERHPRLGNGVLAKLSLPSHIEPEDGPKHANALNCWERTQDVYGHQLGAWTCADSTLTHVTFASNFCWFPGAASVLMQNDAMRTLYMSGLMT